MKKQQDECLRCGTCCSSGGPALHTEDLRLVKEWEIPFSQLITIRVGELAFNPLVGDLQPIRRELVKITGVGRPGTVPILTPKRRGALFMTRGRRPAGF